MATSLSIRNLQSGTKGFAAACLLIWCVLAAMSVTPSASAFDQTRLPAPHTHLCGTQLLSAVARQESHSSRMRKKNLPQLTWGTKPQSPAGQIVRLGTDYISVTLTLLVRSTVYITRPFVADSLLIVWLALTTGARLQKTRSPKY